MNFGNKLAKLRKTNGYTQEKLAEKLGVSRQAVARWEAGETIPDIAMLSCICGIFHVSADYMIDDSCGSGGEISSEIVADYIIHDGHTHTEPEPVIEKSILIHLIPAVCFTIAAFCFIADSVLYAYMSSGHWVPFIIRIVCIAVFLLLAILHFIIFRKKYTNRKK